MSPKCILTKIFGFFCLYFRLVLSDEEVSLGSEPGKMVNSLKCEMITFKCQNSLLQPLGIVLISIQLKNIKSLYKSLLYKLEFAFFPSFIEEL